MLEKIKTDVDGLLLVLTMEKKISVYFAKMELFFILETQTCINLKPIKFANFLSITSP